MDIELLVFSDCPHGADAAALLRSALNDVGLGTVTFRTTVIDHDEAVQQRGFAGSPTFLMNGTDLFPGRPASGGLACRTYPGKGELPGLPELRDLRQALKRGASEAAAIGGGAA